MVQNKMLKQITLFAENKPGRLTSATKILSENGINIRAFTIADTGEFGIIRFVVDDADASLRHLRKAGFTVSETQVIGLEMPDKPGALFEISPFDRRAVGLLTPQRDRTTECRHES